MLSEPGGRGPKLTSLATCANAALPSKPPVSDGGGAGAANRWAWVSGAAALALAVGAKPARSLTWPQPGVVSADSAAALIQSEVRSTGTLGNLTLGQGPGTFAPDHRIGNKHTYEVEHDHRGHEDEHRGGVGRGGDDGRCDSDDEHRVAEISQQELRRDDSEQ